MIETLKPKQTLKAAELQDGDVVCFQRTFEKKGTLAKLGLADKSHESLYVTLTVCVLCRYSVLTFSQVSYSRPLRRRP